MRYGFWIWSGSRMRPAGVGAALRRGLPERRTGPRRSPRRYGGPAGGGFSEWERVRCFADIPKADQVVYRTIFSNGRRQFFTRLILRSAPRKRRRRFLRQRNRQERGFYREGAGLSKKVPRPPGLNLPQGGCERKGDPANRRKQGDKKDEVQEFV